MLDPPEKHKSKKVDEREEYHITEVRTVFEDVASVEDDLSRFGDYFSRKLRVRVGFGFGRLSLLGLPL